MSDESTTLVSVEPAIETIAVVETPTVSEAAVAEAIAEIVASEPAKPVAPVVPTAPKGLVKFAEGDAAELANPYGIKNNRGQVVTMQYLNRYIQCWCRTENGFGGDRKANFTYFMSPEFLEPLRGKTASQVGKAASLDPRWNRPAGLKNSAGGAVTRTPEPKTAAPAAQTIDPASLAAVMQLVAAAGLGESTPADPLTEIAAEPAAPAEPALAEKKLTKRERLTQIANERVAALINAEADKKVEEAEVAAQ